MLFLFSFPRFPFIRVRPLFAFIPLIFGPLISTPAAPLSKSASGATPISASGFFGLPMQFESNAGQTDARVQYLARGPRYTLFLSPTQAVLSLSATKNLSVDKPSGSQGRKPAQLLQAAVQMD